MIPSVAKGESAEELVHAEEANAMSPSSLSLLVNSQYLVAVQDCHLQLTSYFVTKI